MIKNNKSIIIFIFLLVLSIPVARADVIVSVDSPSVEVGKSFDILVTVNPNGLEVAGLQLNLTFDPMKIKINSVSEGNFLKQGGADTFFNSGSIDNINGKVTSIYSAINLRGILRRS